MDRGRHLCGVFTTGASQHPILVLGYELNNWSVTYCMVVVGAVHDLQVVCAGQRRQAV
jgi:hypothetical protein